MFEGGSMLRTCLSFASLVLLAVLLCTPVDSRLLPTAAATHPVAHTLHLASNGTREAGGLQGVPLTRSQLGAILGTSLGALMLVGLWAMRCCLRHVSPDHNHQFADGERTSSPLLTPRTPQSPRGSEGRRSWSSSPATYTAPPVKLLSSPKADLSHGVSGGAVLLFTKDQLDNTREALCGQVDAFVLTALESHFADSRLLPTAAATHPVAHTLHLASNGTREAGGLQGVPLTRSQLGAILGTSLGALMLVGLWAMRCCLRHVSPDHNHQFADGERTSSPLLTPRTPQSPRGSEGRRSWSSSPATYTAPPVKLLSSPKADLSHGVSGGAVLLFTKDQLDNTREALCGQVDAFVLTALESHFAGITRHWLGDGCESVMGPHTSLVDREQLELHWARHRLWQWLEYNMWSGEDNPLVARGKVRDQAINSSNGDGVTKTQAARELLSAIKKNPNHKAFRSALTTFTQQLLSEMTVPAQPVQPSAEPAAAAAAVNAVMESALLFQLQMLGTSAGMQVFVPGVPSAAGVSNDAVVYDDHSVPGSDNSRALCTKPGVLELKSLGGMFQSVVVLPAHAVTREG